MKPKFEVDQKVRQTSLLPYPYLKSREGRVDHITEAHGEFFYHVSFKSRMLTFLEEELRAGRTK